jgi:branched-chain amino acid transport system ATP-binding protein
MARLLEVKGLQAFYGMTQALFGVDFGVGIGKITALLGPNGAGKTTVLRAICQMVRTSGSIVFDSEELGGNATAR